MWWAEMTSGWLPRFPVCPIHPRMHIVPETLNLMNFIPVIRLCCIAQLTLRKGAYIHKPDIITHVF